MSSVKKRIPIGKGLFYLPQAENELPYLIGSKCQNCGYVIFPRADVCSCCLKENTMVEISLSKRGKIDTFAIVQRAPVGFEAPYIMAYVMLPEKVKIFSLISGCEPREGALEIGQEVELIIDKIREDENGNEIIGWKFKPLT